MNNGDRMMNEPHMHMHDHKCLTKCISWSAIFTGAFVGIGLSFLLNLFSVALGLSVFTTSTDGMTTLAIGGFIGLLIGAIVSMFFSGWVSGYLGRPFCMRKNLGALYGFTTWCLMLILTILLASHVGRYVAAYSNTIANPTAVAISTTDDSNMATVTTTRGNTTTTDTVNVEKAANRMGMGALVVFVLFFVGALSSCFGGHCGMMCRREDKYDDDMHRKRM